MPNLKLIKLALTLLAPTARTHMPPVLTKEWSSTSANPSMVDRVNMSKLVAATCAVPAAFSVNPLGENLTKLPEVADVYREERADISLKSVVLEGDNDDPPKDSMLIVDLLLATTQALFACKSTIVWFDEESKPKRTPSGKDSPSFVGGPKKASELLVAKTAIP